MMIAASPDEFGYFGRPRLDPAQCRCFEEITDTAEIDRQENPWRTATPNCDRNPTSRFRDAPGAANGATC
jgi:hypothetical protein